MLIERSASGNTIGGADGAANLISGYGVIGVYINGPGTSGNIVEGNFIESGKGGQEPIQVISDPDPNGTRIS